MQGPETFNLYTNDCDHDRAVSWKSAVLTIFPSPISLVSSHMPTLLPTLNSMPCVHGLSYLLISWWTWPTGNLGRDQKEEEEGEIHNLLPCWTIAEYYLGLNEGRCLPGVALSVELSFPERKGSSDRSHPLLLQRWVVPRISQLLALILNSFLVLDTGLTPFQKHSIIKPSPNCPVPCGVNSALPRRCQHELLTSHWILLLWPIVETWGPLLLLGAFLF